MKTCCTCAVARPLGEYHRSRSTRDGFDPRCKPCRREAHAINGTDVERKRFTHIFRLYGLTREQYMVMLEEQGGLCAICAEPETMTQRGRIKRLCVDHDHETGEIRGLLCQACNIGLGKFNDNPGLLRAAASYLIDQHDVAR